MFIIVSKYLLLMLFIGVTALLFGNVMCSLSKKKREYIKSLLWGVVIFVANHQLTAIYFIIARAKFSSLHNIFIKEIIILFFLALAKFIVNKDYRKYSFNYQIDLKRGILLALTIGIVVLQGAGLSYMHHEDDDDAYYIAISNIAVEQDRIDLEGNFVNNGIKSFVAHFY